MKSRRWLLLLIAVTILLSLSAFSVAPTVQPSNGETNSANMCYLDAKINNDKLTVTVNYNAIGIPFEIGKDMIVSTDSSFSSPLQATARSSDDGKYIYEFEVEQTHSLHTLYVKPPILYMPTEISSVSVPLNGVVSTSAIASNPISNTVSNWFSVRSVNIEVTAQGVYQATVTIDAIGEHLPRFPKLCIGNEEIGGLSALHFNNDGDFVFGEFLFAISADSQMEALQALESASLKISHALLRTEAPSALSLSNEKSIPVVVRGE